MTQPWHRWPWPKHRAEILHRDSYRCQIQAPGCTTHATHVDHIISPIDGGAWFDHRNLRAACAHCNLTRPKAQRLHHTYTPSRDW